MITVVYNLITSKNMPEFILLVPMILHISVEMVSRMLSYFGVFLYASSLLTRDTFIVFLPSNFSETWLFCFDYVKATAS